MTDRIVTTRRPRTTDDRRRLFNEAFCLKTEKARQARVDALQADGTRETLEVALAACRSPSPRERSIGADVLGQLGFADSTPFWAESAPVLAALAAGDESPDVVQAAVVALGHLAWEHADDMRSVVPLLVRLAHHRDRNVRHGVAVSLPRFQDDEAAIASLIGLTRDRSARVRNWATFGLGNQTDVDSAAVREALFERLDDRDQDARSEALAALATREDPRVLERVVAALANGLEGVLLYLCRAILEAAPAYRDPRVRAGLAALAAGDWEISEAARDSVEAWDAVPGARR